MRTRTALALLPALCLLASPAMARSNVATVTKTAPLRAGPDSTYGTITQIEAGTRLDVIEPGAGDAFVRVTAGYYLRKTSVTVAGRRGTLKSDADVYDSRGRKVGNLEKDAKVRVRWTRANLVSLYAYLPQDAVHAPSARADALPGRWQTKGTITPGGDFEGEVVVTKTGDTLAFRASLTLADGKKLSWTGTGTTDGRRVDLTVNAKLPGMSGALSGQSVLKGKGRYDVRRYVRGEWKSDDGAVKLKETWGRWSAADSSGTDGGTTDGGTTDGGTTDGVASKGSITAPTQALAVPGAPEETRQALTVKVNGKAQLTFTGAARVLKDGQAVTSPLELSSGTHTLAIEGTQDGDASFALSAGGSELASATTKVETERLYLLLFGYQGPQETYLVGDVGKCRRQIVPRLGNDYKTIEDGSGYSQKTIDDQINNPKSPRKVVIDWCTTRADLLGYFQRGTVRGVVWGSHGFMEPFPGCPDSELDLFESRVWSGEVGNPRNTEKRNFVREWKDALKSSVQTHGKLDFIVMHSCCTGTIGSYADEVWNYTMAETKTRAYAVLGNPLPTHDKLRYNSFDALAPQATYLKTYEGPSYYGFSDMPWYEIRRSLKPQQ